MIKEGNITEENLSIYNHTYIIFKTSPLTLHYHRIHNLTFHYNIDTSEHHQKLS